jgi:CHAT domain-containing protein/tetratricopeptide (TPR) repeat protein
VRRGLACLVAVVFMVSTGSHAPRAQQPAASDQRQDFAGLYQRWQQAQDPEQKIALGEEALARERSLTTWPLVAPRERVRGELWFGLGSAYVNRTRGVRADNLEKGIAHLEAALQVWTLEADPENWARTHNNVGIAYWGRIRGERADNQESAIAHFEQALKVFSREAAPQEWAQLQNNLAIVRSNRVHGERASNLEAAIAHFEAALTVFTREGAPLLWAMAQNNVGAVYRSRVRGERADNRETAIAHIDAALSVLTREAAPHEWASAQNNLALAYLDRIRGERADNQEKAIAHLEAALAVFTREAFPQQWATAQTSTGNAYADRIRGEPAANRERAIAGYEAALSVFTREAFPRDHLRTGRLLGRLLLQAGTWRKAGLAHASAREAFLLLFGQGLEEAEARTLITDAGPLFADAAFGALQRGETEAALELADEGRARLLAVALRLQALDLPAAEGRRLDELRLAIRAEQQAVEAAQGTERAAAIKRLVALRRELLGLVKSSSQGGPKRDVALAEARGVAAAGGAVVMPILTEFGGKLMVLAKVTDGRGLTVIDLPELTTERLAALLIGAGDGPPAGWIGAYFVNYLSGAEQNRRWPEWLAAIDGLGPELWRLFGARLDAALKERGVQPGARLMWLPSGWLGILPLGLAQDPVSKRRLADDYEIVYAPSLEAFAAARGSVAKVGSDTLAAIINPTGDLPGTEKEGAVVASYFASDTRTLLAREAATPEAVLAALKGKTHWHFASHGTFSWLNVRQSALLMHGPTRLSVGRLLETDGLGRPRLVVLSACETGLSEITANPDEFFGLPGAFTALGAAGVVATLWPVSDAATALLMAKFYELHVGAGLSPSAALSQAQAWLRAATSDDLQAYARTAAEQGRLQSRHLGEIENELSAEGLARSRNSATVEWLVRQSATGHTEPGTRPLARPYAHPYFWAGFVHTGL